ncbi:4a-hydroxytetrahydrobiopterin dehydratase [Synechococcus sp. PCC 7336]|uniref:4a-hydroxytetrahydrobiopterin dehydratase n=1 Tax=Synechococcus sp. PCC 7336 TaxID=195250 RepID=UPI00034B6B23|nr:4a-hydroxytetrahydrobiopterin dehydratase [Synechococcus sp. PCC 7336]
MAVLAQQTCIPCRGDMPPASAAEIAALAPQVPDWNIVKSNGEDRLERTYLFADFKSALAFSQRVGEAADRVGHHPAILTEWGKVTVTWWTHAIHGLHRNDFIMAARTDEIARAFS